MSPNSMKANVCEIAAETITTSLFKEKRCSTRNMKAGLSERKKFGYYEEQVHRKRAPTKQQPTPQLKYGQIQRHAKQNETIDVNERGKPFRPGCCESEAIQHIDAEKESLLYYPSMGEEREMEAKYRKDEFAKVAKKKSCMKSRFVLLESLSVIRALRWAISFALVIDSAWGLRLTNMTVPLVADTRDDMQMDCHYDMGAEILYAVKWYKDDQEFFRFMPHQQPHQITFPVAGVHMETAATKCDETRCKLRLTNLTREHSGGAYRCEVSSEAPAFRLASETQNVTVATLPLDSPRITGLADTYALDDVITLECISGAGDPTPQLTWYINNQPAPAENVGESFTTQVNEKTSRRAHAKSRDGNDEYNDAVSEHPYRMNIALAKRTQPLRMKIERRHLQGDGSMLVQCISTLPAMSMVQPQTVGSTVTIRPKAIQVNNEKLFLSPDYASSSAATTRITFVSYVRKASSNSRIRSNLTSCLSYRNFQILAINLLLIKYYL